jgi:uncharacterized protein YegJ (DUF2314 family)
VAPTRFQTAPSFPRPAFGDRRGPEGSAAANQSWIAPAVLELASCLETLHSETMLKKLLPVVLSLPLVAALLLAGCAPEEPVPHGLGRSVMRTPGEPNMYQVADKDTQMERATRQARRAVPQFVTALQNPAPGDRDFAVKKLFVKDGQAEHIWLTDVHFIGNRFVVLVDNRPRYIAGLKLGDKVSVNPNEISDWSYVRNGQLVGGYTIRVLFAEMTPDEQAQFLKEAKFQISR